MNINYVTLADETMPAVRYRMLLPASYIGECHLSKIPVQADLHFFTKPYMDDPVALECYLAMAKKVNYVFDLCDDIFQREGIVPEYIRNMMKGAVCVTTSTETVGEMIKAETGITPVVISDPTEFSQKKIKSIENPSVMWFGSMSNFHTLKDVKCKYPVEVVAHRDAKHRMHKITGFDYTFTEWSVDGLEKAFSRNNIAIIPTKNARSKLHNYLAKSPNRVFEAIRNGLSVVAAPIPAYQKFSEWITLDWDMERGLENVKQLVPEAQEYIEKNHSIEVIGSQWKQLFSQILSSSTSDAEGEFSMAGSM